MNFYQNTSSSSSCQTDLGKPTDKKWGCFEKLLNRSFHSYTFSNLKPLSSMSNLSSKLSKIPFFHFLRVKNRNNYRGQKLTIFGTFCIFPLFLDIFPLWKNTTFRKMILEVGVKIVLVLGKFFHIFASFSIRCQKMPNFSQCHILLIEDICPKIREK